jgi:hypothetical protein
LDANGDDDGNDGISFILRAFESLSLLALLYHDRVSAMWGIDELTITRFVKELKIEFVYECMNTDVNTSIIILGDNFQLFPTRLCMIRLIRLIIDSFFISLINHAVMDWIDSSHVFSVPTNFLEKLTRKI